MVFDSMLPGVFGSIIIGHAELFKRSPLFSFVPVICILVFIISKKIVKACRAKKNKFSKNAKEQLRQKFMPRASTRNVSTDITIDEEIGPVMMIEDIYTSNMAPTTEIEENKSAQPRTATTALLTESRVVSEVAGGISKTKVKKHHRVKVEDVANRRIEGYHDDEKKGSRSGKMEEHNYSGALIATDNCANL